MRPIRGVILDIDGTLLDSNEAHARTWKEALFAHGFPVDLDRVRKAIGMGSDQLLPALASVSSQSAEGKAISKTKDGIFWAEFFDTLEPFSEVRNFLKSLLDRGLKLTVATSAGKDDLGRFLRRVGVEDLLPSTTSSDEAGRSKPAPDLIEVALGKLDLPPDEVVMIGDTPYDIASAKKAGVATIAVRSGGCGWSDHDLAGAIEIYDDVEDLLRSLDQSPFFESPKPRKTNSDHDSARNPSHL